MFTVIRLVYVVFVSIAFLWVVALTTVNPSTAQAERLQHFTLEEFKDRITGEVIMDPEFLKKLDELRKRCGFPLYVVSGYRSPKHPVEKVKVKPGQHTNGTAVDIRALSDVYRYIILKHAIDLGFTGIGVYTTHIHLDTRKSKTVLWVL
tara:strand:+ start:24133 stop:24579 length:447 start_codon:yes stop_codon:yes gene_type:complete